MAQFDTAVGESPGMRPIQGVAYPQTIPGKRAQVAHQEQRRMAYKSFKSKEGSPHFTDVVVPTATQPVR